MKGEQGKLRKLIYSKNEELQKAIEDKSNPRRLELIRKNIAKIQILTERLNHLRSGKTLPKLERYDNVRREILDKYNSLHSEQVEFICPKCKGKDYLNTLNGKPWCFKCNTQLVRKNDEHQHTMKIIERKYPHNLNFLEA